MKRWVAMTGGDEDLMMMEAAFTPSNMFKSPEPQRTDAAGVHWGGISVRRNTHACLLLSPIAAAAAAAERFNRWISASANAEQLSPLRAFDARATTTLPDGDTSIGSGSVISPGASWTSAALRSIETAAGLDEAVPMAVTPFSATTPAPGGGGEAVTPNTAWTEATGSMSALGSTPASHALFDLSRGRGGDGSNEEDEDESSDRSTELSIACSEINAAVGRMQLREQQQRVAVPPPLAAARPHEAMDISPAPAAALAIVRPSSVRSAGLRTPPVTPPEAFLRLIAGADGSEDEIRPQLLRFEEQLGRPALVASDELEEEEDVESEEEEDVESEDEVGFEELAMMTPLAGPECEAAFLRATAAVAGSISPLTEVLALMEASM